LNPLKLVQMSDEEFWDYARQRASAIPASLSCAEYLECQLQGENCLIALDNLAEVLPPPHRLARLPEMPVWMAGIMSWRGEVIAVVNLDRYLFASETHDYAWETNGMLMVVGKSGQLLGLLVPALGFTSTIEFEQIQPQQTPTGFAIQDEAGIVEGCYSNQPIVNISSLLTRLVREIGTAAEYHG
jgi:chemotaxis signal transduction protein